MQPVLFLSHGSPMLALQNIPAHRFLSSLGPSLERPAAIVVISAHWETTMPMITSDKTNATIHDFGGFPAELFKLTYPAPGAPELAERVADLLGAAGLRTAVEHGRGLDHGAWVPLLLMWPDHTIPVLQLSVQSGLGPGHHLQLGRALAEQRRENVLVIASGSFTHNLRALQRGLTGTDATEPEWVSAFADWMHTAIMTGRTCDLVSYRHLAPFAAENHPTDEHILPLFAAIGAAGEGRVPTRIHQSTDLGVLRMDSYRFD